MLNSGPDTGIDSIFNLNTESTSLIDVPVTIIVEPPFLSTTTLPPPPNPLITHLQQTPVPTPTTAPSSSLQDLPNSKSDEQNNLYKALVDAYESEKLILGTYGETVLFKRCRDEENKDEEPSAGSNWGSKRRRAGKELESTKTSQLPDWFQKPAKPPTPDRDWNKTLLTAHGPVQLWLSTLAQKEDTQLEYFFEEVYKETTDQLDWNNPEGLNNNNSMDLLLTRNLLEMSNSKRRIIAVTKLQIVEWHNYKHLDWITVRRDDDKLYTFKEGDFNRLHIQDIEDMLLLLVQGKLTNLTIEERLAFNVSLRMFTRSVVIQRRVEDLQLGVESYQKKDQLTKGDFI
ncbi:hypothetical protein Tco_0178991 [Tanacetum coccineum]